MNKQSNAQRTQVGGDHYRSMAVQPWEAILASQGPQGFMDYLRGTALAYLMRAGSKDPEHQDVAKAVHVLQRWLEVSKETGGSCGE